MQTWQPRQEDILNNSSTVYQLGQAYLQRADNLENSISRRHNPHDNARTERFCSLLKHERTRHRTYKLNEVAPRSGFSHVEAFYNPVSKRRRLFGTALCLCSLFVLSNLSLLMRLKQAGSAITDEQDRGGEGERVFRP